ncbi:DUF4139 domain-containing protein [Jannaschia aquimarina]|nr:DUF4139 domain-containing protein [Jannaschia aquimarina]
MRAILLASLALPGIAFADDVPLRAGVTSATIYPAGAEVVRETQVDVPEGAHRLLIPFPPGVVPDVVLDGASLTGVAILPDAGLDLEALDSDAQARARDAVEAAENETEAAARAVEAARAEIRGAEIRLRWLQTLTGGGEGGLRAPRDAEGLTTLLGTLAEQVAQAEADRVAASEAVSAAEDALTEAREAEAEARAALARLRPLPEDVPVLAISADVPEAGEIDIRIEGFDRFAGWSPLYDMRLDTKEGTLALDRKASIRIGGAELWSDIDLALSTANPTRGTDPAPAFPDPARTVNPNLEQFAGDAVAEPLVMEESAPMQRRLAAPAPAAAQAVNYGLSLTYTYPRPVTLEPGAEVAILLDTLALEAETALRAVPRRDETAFLMADVTNMTAETILPGPMTLYRDGDRLGTGSVPLTPPGGELQVGFGPVDTIQLEWERLTRDEGDTGIFRTNSTLRERVAFVVRNTGADPEEVTALYSLPFSEQEDVGVEVAAQPGPSEMDWRFRRGVAAWEMTLEPGEERRVELTFEIDWPEGQQLRWQP